MSSGDVSGGSGEVGGARGSGARAAAEDEVSVEAEVVGESGGCCGPHDLEVGEREVVLPKWCPKQSPKEHQRPYCVPVLVVRGTGLAPTESQSSCRDKVVGTADMVEVCVLIVSARPLQRSSKQ